jgi:hypothetical protein
MHFGRLRENSPLILLTTVSSRSASSWFKSNQTRTCCVTCAVVNAGRPTAYEPSALLREDLIHEEAVVNTCKGYLTLDRAKLTKESLMLGRSCKLSAVSNDGRPAKISSRAMS